MLIEKDKYKIIVLQETDLKSEYSDIAKNSSQKTFRRRLEYLLSRQALTELFKLEGLAYDFPLDTFSSGFSLPANYIASISHSRPYAAAIIARKSDYKHIGIDIECLDRQLKSGFAQRICNKSELYIISSYSNPVEQEKQTINIFSAKEAAYKAYSDQILNFNYKDLQVDLSEGKQFFTYSKNHQFKSEIISYKTNQYTLNYLASN